MKMFDKQNQIKLWGNHIDPEVSAEEYLNCQQTEVAQWADVQKHELQQLDRDTLNLYRRHMANCDLRNTDAVLEKRVKKEVTLSPQKGTQPKDPTEHWINNMFSKRPADLFQLVQNESLAQELKNLTPRQQEVVHMSIVRQMKNSEIAKRLETTDRNVRDILKRTYDKLRTALDNNRGEIYPSSAPTLLAIITIPTFYIGWKIANIIYPKLKKAVVGQVV